MSDKHWLCAICVVLLCACSVESHEGDITKQCDDVGGAGSAGENGGAAGEASFGGAAGSGALACEDIAEESACAADASCEPIYAGIDCSCGPDCTCIGGTPGCVCESFEFFECRSAP